MRILLLPRSIEHQFVKKVGQCPDVLDLMRVILAPGRVPGGLMLWWREVGRWRRT